MNDIGSYNVPLGDGRDVMATVFAVPDSERMPESPNQLPYKLVARLKDENNKETYMKENDIASITKAVRELYGMPQEPASQ